MHFSKHVDKGDPIKNRPKNLPHSVSFLQSTIYSSFHNANMDSLISAYQIRFSQTLESIINL